jgi:hypothetical protein
MVQSPGLALTSEWSHIAAERPWRPGWLRRCANALRQAAAGNSRERARRDLMALDPHLRRDVGLEPIGPAWYRAGPSSALNRWIDLRS